jgi:uncharacterized protein YndB with AHSA1/START domain
VSAPMRLNFDQKIPASPSVVWRLITEPPLMNRWSTAKVKLLAAGDAGEPGGVGAYRTIDVRSIGRSMRLKEVIEDADAPHRLVYRVVDIPSIRAHRGEIVLEPTALGTDLRWTVDFEMALGSLEALSGWILRPQLAKSLERMASIAREVSAAAPPREVRRPFRDPGEPELWRAAEAVLGLQRELADRLDVGGDPKRWFSRVYAYVTEDQLEWARSGNIRHVGWVLRLIPRFHHYYADNLQKRMGEIAGAPEPHWEAAFAEMEGARRRRPEPRRMLFIGLLRGMRAHIEEDLPRALAEIWVRHYADRCDYARFRADYLSMGNIFIRSSERLMARVPPTMLPWYFRGPGAWMPPELKDRIRRKRYYDLPRERLLAFERGERIARMLRSNGSRASGDRKEAL